MKQPLQLLFPDLTLIFPFPHAFTDFNTIFARFVFEGLDGLISCVTDGFLAPPDPFDPACMLFSFPAGGVSAGGVRLSIVFVSVAPQSVHILSFVPACVVVDGFVVTHGP